MIYNSNQIYGKVWKVEPSQNGKYMDLQMTTSEKDSEGNGYINSSWYPRVIGHALNSLKNIKEGDEITITKSKFTNERHEDKDGKKRSFFKFLIFEASIRENNDKQPVNPPQTPEKTETNQPTDEELEIPW